MTPMTWFGHPSTWILLFAVWLFFSALTALVFSMIAKAGRGSERE